MSMLEQRIFCYTKHTTNMSDAPQRRKIHLGYCIPLLRLSGSTMHFLPTQFSMAVKQRRAFRDSFGCPFGLRFFVLFLNLKHLVSTRAFAVSSTREHVHKHLCTFRTIPFCCSADKELKKGLKEAKHSTDQHLAAIGGRRDPKKSHFSASFSQTVTSATILMFCRQMEEAGWFKKALRQLNCPQSRSQSLS